MGAHIIPPVVLTGGRIRLEPLRPEHADLLYPAAMHPEIWDYLPERAYSRDEFNRLIANALRRNETGDYLHFAVCDKENEAYVGSTSLSGYSKADRHIEIGWTWYTPKVWRTFVNTECKYLLLSHSFEGLGVQRVQLKTDGRNQRSQAAIRRIGAVYEGTLRKERTYYDGYTRDSVYFSILDEEWPAVKARLEAMLAR